MKKLIALILSALLLAGCTKTPAENPVISSDNVSVNICTTYANSGINYNKLAELSDITVNASELEEDYALLKILAGDSDVDIYLITATLARTLLDKNIYVPIESEIIDGLNNTYFDYISDACKADNGDIALIPIYSYVPSVVYPIEAQKEFGFEREDLIYYDGFMELAQNHNTQRHIFQTGNIIFEGMNAQYEQFYCDFDNLKFDYTTDLYKSFYSELLSYVNADTREHKLFTHPNYYVDERYPQAKFPYDSPKYYADITLLSIGRYSYVDYADECESFFEQWRALPTPKISEKVTGNYIEVTFAYINPYSKNISGATKALEAIAQNLPEISQNEARYSFLYKDKSAYPSRYHTDSQVFNDFYDIAHDGFLSDYRMSYEHRGDMREFQNGNITLDEAVAMYQREVEIWLKE